jgi:hypothetical protein
MLTETMRKLVLIQSVLFYLHRKYSPFIDKSRVHENYQYSIKSQLQMSLYVRKYL